MNVFSIIENSAKSWPHRPAIIDEYGSLDYQELCEQVNQVRDELLKLGVRQGHGVGVMGKNSRAFIISAFAALGCGATVLPISSRLKQAEVESLLEVTALHAMLYDGSGTYQPGVDRAEVSITDARSMQLAWTEADQSRPFVEIVPDAAFVRFTSGTTSASKGVILSHKTVLERITAANKGLKLSCSDAVLWVLPMAFHFFVSIILYLRYGVTIIVCPDHFAETMLELSNRHKATFLYAAPVHYRLLAADTSGVQFETLRLAISTSTSLPAETAGVFWSRYGIAITQAFGIIEVGLPLINMDRSLERPESIGKALPDYDVALLDDELHPVSNGTIGQLAVKGPGLIDAYMDPPQRRCDILCNGWFLTGDLGFRDDEGFITIAGRSKAMINVGGNKVFPEEVEAVINQHPSVLVSKVSAKPHPQLGEAVHADIICCDRQGRADVEELLSFCRARLVSFKVPQSVSFVKNIEKTGSGKIRRH